jgi:ubiquinone/menaquinone biosynthesis C-methylase UbiE
MLQCGNEKWAGLKRNPRGETSCEVLHSRVAARAVKAALLSMRFGELTMTAANTALDKQGQQQRLMGHLFGYQATWIIDIGLKSGLIRAIADARGVDEKTLAQRLGFSERYVAVWCRAAYAFELIEWSDKLGYALSAAMKSLLLDAADPLFMGSRLQFYAALNEDFRAFPAHLKSGETWPRSAHDCWLLEALKNLTRADSRVMADILASEAPQVRARLDAGGSLLDVGAGGGYALVEYARRFPAASVIGIEIDDSSIALATRTIAEAGLAERVHIERADANTMEAVGAYDVVTMSIALHETGGPAEYRNVLARTKRALRPGGILLISELPYPDSPAAYRDKPVYKLLAGVQFHEALVGCGMIRQGELRELLVGAGFHKVREVEQPLQARLMMIAEKL